MAIHTHYHVVLQGSAASRPATPAKDLLYYATDTGVLSIYDTVGAAWSSVGASGLTLPLSIANGGTGQTTQTAAMDALSPSSAKGDLLVDNGTDVIALTAGTNGKSLFYDSGQTSGFRQDYSTVLVTYTGLTGAVVFLTTTGAGYAQTYAVSQCELDFTRFRESRLIMNAAVVGGSTNATFKFVDLTNTVDITTTVNVNSGATGAPYVSTWSTLNALTTGDIRFELQGKQGVAADQINIYGVWLELR